MKKENKLAVMDTMFGHNTLVLPILRTILLKTTSTSSRLQNKTYRKSEIDEILKINLIIISHESGLTTLKIIVIF